MSEQIDTETGEVTRRGSTFDPGQHLTKIKGQDYLEVKWRLAWLRSEHPDAVLSTNLYSHDNGRAIFSAHVQIPSGGAATGWGSETVDSFENYIEKAETKAIGRALAAVGFGTQFCDDFNDTGAIADAPVGRPIEGSGSFRTAAEVSQGYRNASGEGDKATTAQKSMIQYKARQAQLTPEQLTAKIIADYGKGFNDLTKREASGLIDALGAMAEPGKAGAEARAQASYAAGRGEM